MTTAQMRQISTAHGPISVELGADAATIAILKQAAPCAFHEFCYTGNSSAGQNSGNYDELEAWFVAAGLKIKDDDLSILIYDLERMSGVTTLEHRGKTLRYHVQAHQGESHREYGYTWRADYRLIECR